MNIDCDGCCNDDEIREDELGRAHATHVIENKCMCTLGGKIAEETMWNTRCRWDDNIKIYIKELECDAVDCIFMIVTN